MIASFPKPRPIVLRPKPGQRPKWNNMTIALGMLCRGGAILAADTRMALPDGSVSRATKLPLFRGTDLSFAIAISAEDANAAKSLVNGIAASLGTADKSGWGNIESLITDAMIEWHGAFGQAYIPPTSLIIAIVLNGFGVRLYLCEPPNTVLAKPNGYVAVGCGAAVTNPLYETMFTMTLNPYGPQYILRWISYLMCRAKKGNSACGGDTEAVYVNESENKLEEVSIIDLRHAEATSPQLDFVTRVVAMATMGNNEDQFLEYNANRVPDVIMQCQERFRGTVFRDNRGNILGENTLFT